MCFSCTWQSRISFGSLCDWWWQAGSWGSLDARVTSLSFTTGAAGCAVSARESRFTWRGECENQRYLAQWGPLFLYSVILTYYFCDTSHVTARCCGLSALHFLSVKAFLNCCFLFCYINNRSSKTDIYLHENILNYSFRIQFLSALSWLTNSKPVFSNVKRIWICVGYLYASVMSEVWREHIYVNTFMSRTTRPSRASWSSRRSGRSDGTHVSFLTCGRSDIRKEWREIRAENKQNKRISSKY